MLVGKGLWSSPSLVISSTENLKCWFSHMISRAKWNEGPEMDGKGRGEWPSGVFCLSVSYRCKLTCVWLSALFWSSRRDYVSWERSIQQERGRGINAMIMVLDLLNFRYTFPHKTYFGRRIIDPLHCQVSVGCQSQTVIVLCWAGGDSFIKQCIWFPVVRKERNWTVATGWPVSLGC